MGMNLSKLQETVKDKESWHAAVHGVSKSWTRLNNNVHVTGIPGGSVVKNLPAMQETRVQSLGREDPLEKEMATYSSILAWEIPWIEAPGGL